MYRYPAFDLDVERNHSSVRPQFSFKFRACWLTLLLNVICIATRATSVSLDWVLVVCHYASTSRALSVAKLQRSLFGVKLVDLTESGFRIFLLYLLFAHMSSTPSLPLSEAFQLRASHLSFPQPSFRQASFPLASSLPASSPSPPSEP